MNMAHPPSSASMAPLPPASLVYQEFKCDACDYRSIRMSDVELHKRYERMLAVQTTIYSYFLHHLFALFI